MLGARIEPDTSWLVAQYSNHLGHPGMYTNVAICQYKLKKLKIRVLNFKKQIFIFIKNLRTSLNK
jgi:hypothetical protein